MDKAALAVLIMLQETVMNFLKTTVVLSALLAATACAQQEEVMVETPAMETPIYAKDGTIIGMRPMVSPGGMDPNECRGVVPGGDDTQCEEINADLPGSVDG